MGRDIPVKFQGGGPHAVYLLDGLRARDDNSGWDIETPAFENYYQSGCLGGHARRRNVELLHQLELAGRGQRQHPDLQVGDLSDVGTSGLPVGQQGHLAAGNAVVGLSMSGSAALILAAYHPGTVPLCRVAVGIPAICLTASGRRWSVSPCVTPAASTPPRCGVQAAGRPGSATTRRCNVGRLASNGTRLWVYTGNGTPSELGGADLPATFLEGLTRDSNIAFQKPTRAAGGGNAHLQLPPERHAQLGVLGCAAERDEARHPAHSGRLTNRDGPAACRRPGHWLPGG